MAATVVDAVATGTADGEAAEDGAFEIDGDKLIGAKAGAVVDILALLDKVEVDDCDGIAMEGATATVGVSAAG